MNKKVFIFKELNNLKFVNSIEIEYWTTYNKTLKKLELIFNEQNKICSHHLLFLDALVDNLHKHHFIIIEDFHYFKTLIIDLKNIN